MGTRNKRFLHPVKIVFYGHDSHTPKMIFVPSYRAIVLSFSLLNLLENVSKGEAKKMNMKRCNEMMIRKRE